MSLTNWTVSISAFCGMLSAAIATSTSVNTARQRSRATRPRANPNPSEDLLGNC